MPIYEYECDDCHNHFEIQQSMLENPITTCPECSGKIRRIFSPNPVIFKGNGFYCTDHPHSDGGCKSSEGTCNACHH
jgi:putative FmdB family regulatory protein